MNQDFSQVPEKQYRPEVRWWLAEGMHTDRTLRNEMQQLEDMGMGAIEFLAMDEPGLDDSLYGWGSEEWVHDSHLLVEEAANRQMGVSMTSGTNWACANLITINPDHKAASKELDFVSETLTPGQHRSGPLPKCPLRKTNIHEQLLVAVVAAKVLCSGDRPVLAKQTQVLTDLAAGGTLSWTAPADSTYMLLFFWLHGTGQTANPACSTAYAVNYMDRYGIDAVTNYWDTVVLTPQMRRDLKRCGRGMLYMDSLELFTYGAGGQLFGYHFMEEFTKRRGYDLTPYLPFVVRHYPSRAANIDYCFHMDTPVFQEKLRNDFCQTLTELYMENTLRPLQAWAHTADLQLRAEIAYGLPLEISLPGKYVDGIETESLEFGSQVDSYRAMAGAAHIYGRTFSSETGASLSNYMLPLNFYNQIIFAQFAAGVTKTVFHGYSSICGSEEATEWPGHEGMWPKFSERFGPRQPAYRHYPEWTAMIARFQKLLRAGKPRQDLGIMRLDYFINNLRMDLSAPREEYTYAHTGMRADEAFYWRDMGLQHNGYTWDYFAPQLLEEPFTVFRSGELYPDGPGYRALLVYQEAMPLGAARALLGLVQTGLPVVFVNGATEEIRNGLLKTHSKAACRTPFVMESDEELAEIISRIKAQTTVRETDDPTHVLGLLQELGVLPRAAFAESNSNVLTCMRQTGRETNLFVYHMKYAQNASTTVTLRIEGGGRPYLADCWTGHRRELSGTADERITTVTLTLQPGEATMIVLDRTSQPRQLPRRRCDCELALERWHLTVEDWNAGEKHMITEDRGLGLVTREVYFDTKKTLLDAGQAPLLPWQALPAIGPDVSGVGFYTTAVTLDSTWAGSDAELVLGSTNGSTAAVYVNGQKAECCNINRPVVQVGHLLRPGENTILVEVTSTLNNRLLARGYFAAAMEKSNRLRLKNGNETPEQIKAIKAAKPISSYPRDYGLTGKVFLRRFTRQA